MELRAKARIRLLRRVLRRELSAIPMWWRVFAGSGWAAVILLLGWVMNLSGKQSPPAVVVLLTICAIVLLSLSLTYPGNLRRSHKAGFSITAVLVVLAAYAFGLKFFEPAKTITNATAEDGTKGHPSKATAAPPLPNTSYPKAEIPKNITTTKAAAKTVDKSDPYSQPSASKHSDIFTGPGFPTTFKDRTVAEAQEVAAELSTCAVAARSEGVLCVGIYGPRAIRVRDELHNHSIEFEYLNAGLKALEDGEPTKETIKDVVDALRRAADELKGKEARPASSPDPAPDRHITVAQARAIGAALSRFGVSRAGVATISEITERTTYADEVAEAFRSSGWTIVRNDISRANAEFGGLTERHDLRHFGISVINRGEALTDAVIAALEAARIPHRVVEAKDPQIALLYLGGIDAKMPLLFVGPRTEPPQEQ